MTTAPRPTNTGTAPAHVSFNPYRASAGSQLDQVIHEKLFGEAIGANSPGYSISEKESVRVVVALRKKYSRKVVVGKTNTRPAKFFARLETDPSTSIEALAETEALAICRLAAVLVMR